MFKHVVFVAGTPALFAGALTSAEAVAIRDANGTLFSRSEEITEVIYKDGEEWFRVTHPAC